MAKGYKQEKKQLVEKEIEKQRAEAIQREEDLKRKLQENQPKIDQIREREEKKVKEKYELMEEKRNYLQNKEERINKAVEDYSCRPKVEIDR